MVSGARSVGILQGMDLLRRSSCVASAALLLLCAAPARSQDSASTRTGRAAVERCVEAMGGRARLREVRSAAIEIQAKASIKERHTLLLPSRALHYASRREGGAGFDVVVNGDKGFLCDRDPEGKTSYVEDLTEDEPIIAKMPGHQPVKRGDKLRFTADKAKLHLFDAVGQTYRR